MKIEVVAILNWLQDERNRLAKELDKACTTGEVGILLGNLEEVLTAIKALKDYRGDVDE